MKRKNNRKLVIHLGYAALAFVLYSATSSMGFAGNSKIYPVCDTTLIYGKWKIATIVTRLAIYGSIGDDLYSGQKTDYVDIRHDGKIYSRTLDDTDTATFRLTGKNSIWIDSDTLQIKELTKTKLILYKKEPDISVKGNYKEYIYTLEK